MTYQSTGRNQRPKGFQVKQALQIALLLAVCIWLLYQITHSYGESKDNGGSTQTRLSEKQGGVILGRKGDAGWSNHGGDLYSEDVDLMGESEKKEDGGAGDDELDWNPKEKAEAESYLKGHDNAPGRVTDHDEKVPERLVKEPQNYVKDINSTLLQDKDEAVKENAEDKGTTKTKFKIRVHYGEMFNATVPVQRETEDGVHSFHDENGIPQDDQKRNSHQEPISSSNNQSRIIESKPLEGDDVEFEEESVTAYVRTENKNILEDPMNDTTVEAENDSETSGALTINHASETVQEQNVDYDDSHPVSFQQELEELNNISMLSQAE